MSTLAVIGGTGLSRLSALENVSRKVMKTPYGAPSSPLMFGELDDMQMVFLARHGYGHTIPPHRINYRANIWALKEMGVKDIVAVAAVGSMNKALAPSDVVLPDQIIDYTYSRAMTFFEEELEQVKHIDFTFPYSKALKDELKKAAEKAGLTISDQAVYGCTQGPRLETAAEIKRMTQDGCDLVGMTGMPETALARELDLNYASCCVVVNWAAGLDGKSICHEQIEAHAKQGMDSVHLLLKGLAQNRL